MIFTKVRAKFNGKKLDADVLEHFAKRIVINLREKGFITGYEIVNSQSFKLSCTGMSFKIDVDKLGYNTRFTPDKISRTCTPSWNQRVEYNNTINEVLDLYHITCNVKNTFFKIREGEYKYNEAEWYDQIPSHQHVNESRGYNIQQGDYKKDFENVG